MATISFSLAIRLDLSTKQFKMVDTSNYAGQGIDPNAITGSFLITAPSGNPIYNNLINYADSSLADIAIIHGTGTQTTIPFSSFTENGLYTIYYKVLNDDGLTEPVYEVTETFEYLYASPTVQINGTVAVYTPSPLITLQDVTVYQVNNITPTISRVATISYEPMIINNVLTTPTPTVGSTATTTSNYFFSPTTELLSVISHLTFEYTGTGVNSSFEVQDIVSGSESLFVDATSYCGTVCGLNSMALQVKENPQNQSLVSDFNLAMSYWTLIMANQNCGKTDLINGWLIDIQTLGHFDKSCMCCSDTFQQVVGLGGLVSAYDIIPANAYIGVSSNTSGGTKTYTITLQQAFIDQVTANTNDIIVNTSDISDLYGIVSFMFTDKTTISSSNIVVTTPTNTAQAAVFITSSGYIDGETVTLVGGTHTSAATFEVFGVTNGIAYLSPQNAGAYTVIPSNPVTLSGGSGSGTVNVSWLTNVNLAIPFVEKGSNTPITLSTTVNTKGLATDTNIVTAGRYWIMFTGDLKVNSGLFAEYNYYPVKNSNTINSISINGTSDKCQVLYLAPNNSIVKVSFNMMADLLANDLVNVVFAPIGGTDAGDLTNTFYYLIRVSN